MSGHSKWNNIKHKKEKADAAKAKIFTKIGKEMAIAIKAGGPDPNNNSRLRDLIAKAKANNVPNDNIQRTIKKFTDSSDINFEEIKSNIADLRNEREIEFYISLIVGRIENLENEARNNDKRKRRAK